MNANQQNRLSMFLAVLGVMEKYNSAWSAMTAIAEMVTRLTGYTATIQDKSGVQGTALTGIAGGKRRARMEMIQRTLAIAGDVHALAIKNSDLALQGKVDLQLTDLLRLNETQIAPHCQQIHDLANANQAALADYGVTKEDITALQTAITAYTDVLTKPRQAVVGRKEVTGSIAQDEDAADKLLKNELDLAMRKFKTKNAPFFGEYSSARMIIDFSDRHAPQPGTPTAAVTRAAASTTATGQIQPSPA
jgi:hypothetical protein